MMIEINRRLLLPIYNFIMILERKKYYDLVYIDCDYYNRHMWKLV